MRKLPLALLLFSSPIQSIAGISSDVVFKMADAYHLQLENPELTTPLSGLFPGYVIGIASILNIQGKICIPDETTNRTVLSQVYDYLHANQGLKQLSEGAMPVMLALSNYYKCKK